jgi:hypothetical protein
MNIWKKLFGDETKKAAQTPQQPHPALKLIQEASAIADDGFQLKEHGGITVMTTNSDSVARLHSAIDKALAVAPDDADLLIAKYLVMPVNDDTARQSVFRRALTLAPNHFDGRMLRDHAGNWEHLFMFPSWSEGRSTLNPVMSWWLEAGQSLQIVRDGLSLGLAVVCPWRSDAVPKRINRSGWKIFWSKTPHGPIACHYGLLDLDADHQIIRQEAFAPHIADKEPGVRNPYWILRRLPHLKSCFVVFAAGDRLIHNARFEFTDSLRSTIATMNHDLEASGPVRNESSCQAAVQWYMQNVDFNSIGF